MLPLGAALGSPSRGQRYSTVTDSPVVPMTEVKAQDHIRDLVLSAYAKFEAEAVDDPAPDAPDEAAASPW